MNQEQLDSLGQLLANMKHGIHTKVGMDGAETRKAIADLNSTLNGLDAKLADPIRSALADMERQHSASNDQVLTGLGQVTTSLEKLIATVQEGDAKRTAPLFSKELIEEMGKIE